MHTRRYVMQGYGEAERDYVDMHTVFRVRRVFIRVHDKRNIVRPSFAFIRVAFAVDI